MEKINEDNLSDYERAVHSIKGTSLDIFAEQIGYDAAELEKAAEIGDLSYIKNHNSNFIKAVKKLLCDLENILKDTYNEDVKQKKDKIDTEVLAKLLTACEGYDIDKVDAAMTEIENYQYEAEEKELTDWLRTNVDLMEFEQIAERLSGYRK